MFANWVDPSGALLGARYCQRLMKRALIGLGAVLLPALVLLGTLTPGTTSDSGAWHLRMDAADSVRNVLFFVPLGAWTVFLGLRTKFGLLACLIFSGSVELAQMWVPGRFPAPADVLANTAGASIGIGLVRSAPIWLASNPATLRSLQWFCATAAAFMLLASAALFQVVSPGFPYHCDYRPGVAGMISWSGRVLGSSLGNLRVSNSGLLDPVRVDAELAARSPLRLELVRGDRNEHDATILMLAGREHDEVWLVAEGHDEISLRLGSRAQQLGFYGPMLRFDVLDQVAPGERFVLGLQRVPAGVSLTLNDAVSLERVFTLGDGWRHFAGLETDLRARTLPNAAWLALLLVPLGTVGRPGRRFALLLLPPLVGLLALPATGLVAPSPPSEWFGAALGIGAGFVLGAALRRFSTSSAAAA